MDSAAAALDRLATIASSAPVARLAAAFEQAGHELALVGGPVRDAFLSRTALDLDLTTDARPDRILEIVTPISSARWDVGRAFGTIGALVAGEKVEITTYRSDAYEPESRKPEVRFGDTLEEDLVRRDFTVNAMALRVPGRVLVDPTGGIDDLLARRLRTPQTPETSFSDDPLRMLRAARFAAQLGFSVEEDTRAAMERLAERLEIVSAERVREELSRLVLSGTPRPGLELLVGTGIADRILPELPALRLTVDLEHRHKDVYEHSLTVLEQSIELERERGHEPDLVLRLAALLHDVGKPATRRFERGGAVTFHHHDVVGAKLVRKRLRALRYDNDTIARVAELVELHQRFFGYTEGVWTDSAVRRYVRDAGDQLERLHILTRADVTTRNRRKAERLASAYDDLERRIGELAEQEQLEAVRPDLDGERIMAILGIRPGPDVGRAYRFLLELRLDEGPLGEDEATRRLLDWWGTQLPAPGRDG
ncbi:CCA tRNA nucleotidyltransferase [Naasia aerilata]|uniref:CCA tRNA nucleotidyltransferase n=1 Tax=Naasia aerilata TaxID=1162966 RepID=A0ABN6XKF8_9MICO|nr:CCA tRNA nucleotidyltransferase [Naasia aerilata]BDZ45359.1 CCA tRNA nucleotidyltransferase [Naasia aerilata]